MVVFCYVVLVAIYLLRAERRANRVGQTVIGAPHEASVAQPAELA
jgi:hypothetical protein